MEKSNLENGVSRNNNQKPSLSTIIHSEEQLQPFRGFDNDDVKDNRLVFNDFCVRGLSARSNDIDLNIVIKLESEDDLFVDDSFIGTDQESNNNYNVKSEIKDESAVSDEKDFEPAERIEYPPNTCIVCETTFESANDLKYHQDYSKITKIYACCKCDKRFRDTTRLRVHHRGHTGEKPYVCDICFKSFSISGNLKKHKFLHTGERRFSCEICERTFTQLAHLKDHMVTHDNDRPFVCYDCNSSFKRLSYLKKHISTHTSTTVKSKTGRTNKLKCDYCESRFCSFKLLYEHRMQHTGEVFNLHGKLDSTLCSECGKQCPTHEQLLKHIRRVHFDIQYFKCEKCFKKFTCKSRLLRHLRSHAGIKPYMCDMCYKTFPSNTNLQRHIIHIHKGERPFLCQICDRQFSSLGNMQRHVRIHTQEKPYPCPICARRFAHSSTVKEHLSTHSKAKPYGCGICNKYFSLNKHLYRHFRVRHPEELEGRNVKDMPKHEDFLVTIKDEPIDEEELMMNLNDGKNDDEELNDGIDEEN